MKNIFYEDQEGEERPDNLLGHPSIDTNKKIEKSDTNSEKIKERIEAPPSGKQVSQPEVHEN